MAYSVTSKKAGKSYFLHSKTVTLRGGNGRQTIYWFAGKAGKGSLDALPDGYKVIESKRTGLPMLKKK